MIKIKKFINNFYGSFSGENKSDKGLLLVVATIIIFGLIMLSSASAVVAYNIYGDSYYFVKHQLIGLIFGVIAFLVLAKIDYHLWRKYAIWMLFFSIFLLVLVFIPGLGREVNNSRSWIAVAGHSLMQPAEFVKLTFLLYLAAWLESRKEELKKFSQGIGPFILILGLVALLMILQPDIGTLIIIGLTSLTVYFVGGGKLSHIVIILLVGVVAVGLLAQYKPHILNRFKCFVDPSFSTQGECYQVVQSTIAVGSGGIFGRGLGASRQKYFYLPEVQADAIFPIIGEETGLIFSIGLIILYFILFYRGFIVAKHAADDFGRILAFGIVFWIVFQALVNVGGMVNIMPMTGVPLPLISAGGSSLTSTLAALGILMNISKQTKQ